MNILNYLFSVSTAFAASSNNIGSTVNKVGEESGNQLTQLLSGFFAQIPLWIAAAVVAFFSYFAAVIVKKSIESKLAQQGIEEEHREVQIVIGRIAFFVVLTLGVTIALSMVGIDLKPIVAALAFGLGFALQDIIMNLVAGMMILAARHYTIGDVIKVGSITGKIEEIQTRATIIKAFDGTRAVVPNAQLFKNVVVSKTSNPYRKLSFLMGVGYGTNLKDVMSLTLAVVKAVPWVLKKPKPSVIFTDWGDSSINFKINAWIDTKGGKFVKTKNQIIMDLTAAYSEAGIDIPYPIQTVNFDTADHSEAAEKEVKHKIRQMKKALKEKAVQLPSVNQFPAFKEVGIPQITLNNQPPEAQPENNFVQPIYPQNSAPLQQNQIYSPQSAINASGPNWLEQAYSQQSVPNQQNQLIQTNYPLQATPSQLSPMPQNFNPSSANTVQFQEPQSPAPTVIPLYPPQQ